MPSSVVFPAPLAPSSPVTPGPTTQLAPARAWVVAQRLVTPETWITASCPVTVPTSATPAMIGEPRFPVASVRAGWFGPGGSVRGAQDVGGADGGVGGAVPPGSASSASAAIRSLWKRLFTHTR